MQTAISITTINVPTVLDGLTKNIVEHGHTRDTRIIITGDVKTPTSAGHYCREVADATGVDITYLSVQEQRKLKHRFPELIDYLVENSLGLRNIGNLLGYESGADVIIMLDDDNECIECTGDFVGKHCNNLVVRDPQPAPTGIDWFNALGDFHNMWEFKHRGWPAGLRENANPGKCQRAVVSESFCLGEPDVDAIHRMQNWSKTVKLTGTMETYRLGPGIWHPINTQATAFHRDIMPAAFVNPHLKRYDDIWMGYVVRAVSDMMGWGCSFGEPVVGHFQWRTRASVLRDLGDELEGMEHTPAFVAALEQWKSDSPPEDGAFALTRDLRQWLAGDRNLHPVASKGLGVWLQTLDRL